MNPACIYHIYAKKWQKSLPVGAFGTQRRVKAFQDKFLPPDFELDLVHLAEPALGHLPPVRLKLILGKVPELPAEPISKIHEYTQLCQSPLHAPPNSTDKQGGVILLIHIDQRTLKTLFRMKKSRKWRSMDRSGRSRALALICGRRGGAELVCTNNAAKPV